jgi:O-methyltransferase
MKLTKKIQELLGYSITIEKTKKKSIKNKYTDIQDDEFWEIYTLCKPYTMTSVERMYALFNSVKYILINNITGDFVECGVWRGGSSMLVAKMLSNRNIIDRKIFLYDTYEGMTEPTGNDINFTGMSAEFLLNETTHNKETSVWCLADLSDVQKNMNLTGYPIKNIFFIKGKVENTIPENIPNGDIALLRLDTDWYESTKHELIHLFPNLALNGVIIIDDYGHWSG